MQADMSVIVEAPATLARLKRRAGSDRPAPTIHQFEECAAVLAAAEAVLEEAKKVRAKLAQATASARAEGDTVPTHQAIGDAFGTSRQAAELWSKST